MICQEAMEQAPKVRGREQEEEPVDVEDHPEAQTPPGVLRYKG
ncbi:MAG: hypothetical protein U9P80_07155 [Thermodesulfobacteriota bacterium]|nr:hypothetical protein [Thermodesulfobacteriota bacterium]